MKPARALWLLTYLLFSAGIARGEMALPNKEATIKADHLSVDTPTDSYHAEGNVRITQDGASLLADSVIYHRLTGDAVAEGDVRLERGGDTMNGNKLLLNLVTQHGELLNGELFVKRSNFRLRADRLLKTGDADYRVERGTFTTCDGDRPSWHFEASRVDLTLDEYATAKHAVFYVGDIPLFYTPYLIFPANTERQSGLMIPKLGFSSKRGFYIDQPYYWAINQSQEATFNLDVETSRGVGSGVEYRYLRPRGSQGYLHAFGIYDTNENGFRGEVQQRHLEILTPDLTLASTIHMISDRRYYLDYGEFSGEYNRQLLESTVSFDRRWDRYGLSGDLRYAQDLEAPTNDATLQRLPRLSFIAAGDRIGPLLFSMDSSVSNFIRDIGATGQRLVVHPRLAYYAKPGGALDLSLYGGFQQRLYNARGDSPDPGWHRIGQADGGATVSLPLERIYDGTTRHLLVPELQYVYVERRADQDLPLFDYDDRVLGQSIAYLSLSNTFTRKYVREGMPDEYRDILYLKLAQGYQFSGERRDLLTLVDEGNKLTDLMLESVVTPMQNLSLLLDGRYNMEDNEVSTANIGVEYKGEGKKDMARLSYRHSKGELDYLDAGLVFPLGTRFTADLEGRYSFDRGAFLGSRYALEYRQQCWSVVLAYSDRVRSHQVTGEQQFTINFSLAGLGSLGPMRTM
ncbi:LPS-assembly protein LptD [Geomonas oryzae]|uniref:LPS-assembly protein LptD n=1 Tax=Geomonas oryzae TaxID=2364273 RepID=UPI00100AED43|nr:LPS assembly protein LptD [Geomonas oryzae]